MILNMLRDGKLKLQEGMIKEQHDEINDEFSFYKIPFVSLIHIEILTTICAIIEFDCRKIYEVILIS